MIEISYENIYRFVAPTLPSMWESIVIRAVFADDSCDIKYYIVDSSNSFCDCFELDCDQRLILEILANVHQEISFARNSLEAKKRWNAVTIVIDCEGNFNADFDYAEVKWPSDVSAEWTKKYLKK